METKKCLVAIADYDNRKTTPKVKECFNHPFFKVVTFGTKAPAEFIFDLKIGEGLPFAHRGLFASEVENFDYFFYTENDIEYSLETLAYLFDQFDIFGKNKPLGLIRHEEEQLIDFGAVLKGSKIRSRHPDKGYFVATNDHQASYLLSKYQLQTAIASGNYLITAAPRCGYGQLETGASNVYFECDLEKVYPYKNLDTLLVKHMDLKWKFLQPRYTLDNLKNDLK